MNQKQLNRIKLMESYLDEATLTVKELSKAGVLRGRMANYTYG